MIHDLSEYRYMDNVTRNYMFSLLCWTWHTGLKIFVRLFIDSKQVKSLKKVQQEPFTSKKNGESGKNTTTTTAIMFSSLWETCCFAKCFCHYFALSKKRHWKTFQRNCSTKKVPKLAQILEQSSSTRQVCLSVFCLFWSLCKTNRFHGAVGLFSNRL